MIKYLNLVGMILFLSSCSFMSTDGLKPRTVEDYYVSTGVEKYFLTDIPAWSNFDQKAECFRNTNIRYFNIDALMKSYNLNYNKALQVQASFNEEAIQFKKINPSHMVTLKEEELLFYKVSEKISSKMTFFDPPTFKRINLVWLDEVLGDPAKENKLKYFLNSETMVDGVPVLLSLCLTREEVEKRFPQFNTKMITAELFSVFDSSGKKMPGFKIELDQFFNSDQKIYFYSQKNNLNHDELKGLVKQIHY
jgi:hypothetical protein